MSSDYESFFSEFGDAEPVIEEETNLIVFKGTKTVPQSISEEEVGLPDPYSDEMTIEYVFNYSADTNEFFLSVTAFTDKEMVTDRLSEVPFITDSEKIDIGFATEDGPVFLSELENNELIQNCGWFSKILKKVAVVATVVAVTATVVAVVVVAGCRGNHCRNRYVRGGRYGSRRNRCNCKHVICNCGSYGYDFGMFGVSGGRGE